MTKRPARNMAASVHQRLLQLAKDRDRRFNDLLQHYALERWLYRLSRSEHAEKFVLKGALMLTVWNIPVTRPTRDIDLLARTSNDLENIRQLVATICQTPVEDDGLVFEHGSVKSEPIAEDAVYQGVRANFLGFLGNARIPMQVDLGFSDVVTPAPVEISYPTVLDMPAPRLRAYNRETAIAEKFEAMVKLGELNSRMKDFFDIWALSASGSFEGEILHRVVRETFARRGLVLDLQAICFGNEFANRPDKEAQWKAFLKRGQLVDAPATFKEAWSSVMTFLRPVAEAHASGTEFVAKWSNGGPWKGQRR